MTCSYLPKTERAGPIAEMKKSAPRMSLRPEKVESFFGNLLEFIANVLPKAIPVFGSAFEKRWSHY